MARFAKQVFGQRVGELPRSLSGPALLPHDPTFADPPQDRQYFLLDQGNRFVVAELHTRHAGFLPSCLAAAASQASTSEQEVFQ